MATEQNDQLCLENIDEFVHDENKIVTCKWLSLTLKIHINQAKRLLYTFLQQQRNKKEKEVSATYFVAGLTKGTNGTLEHTCLVVPEEDLEPTRSQMAVVTSCHVYSVQRSQLKDSNALYMTDYDGVKENLSECSKYSSIHCKRAEVPRKVTRPAADTPSEKKNKDVQYKKENGSAGDAPQNGTAPSVSKSKKNEAKGSIASMFAQSAKKAEGDGSKAKEESSASAASKKDDKKGGKGGAKKGGVMDFFANAKPPAKKKEEERPTQEKKEESPKEKPAAETTAKGKTGTKAQEANSRKKGRSKDDSDDDSGPQKKRRRRIKNDLFDSSSDEDEMEVEVVESPVPSPVREPSPEPQPESPTPEKRTEEEEEKTAEEKSTNGSKGRRRKRKLVPKTYLDEDGFMVTEKVWESESTDASEVEEEPKKKTTPTKKAAPAPAKKASPQKKGSPAKGKQTSLMSFFKKK